MILKLKPKPYKPIETDRLILRSWKKSDLGGIFSIGSDPKVMEHYPSLQTKEEAQKMMETINQSIADNGYGLFCY